MQRIYIYIFLIINIYKWIYLASKIILHNFFPMDDVTEGHNVIDSMINKLKFTTCGPMNIMYFNSNEDDNNYYVSIWRTYPA